MKDIKKDLSVYQRAKIMLSDLEKSSSILRPSKYWGEINQVHIKLLKHGGYSNFKSNLARQYFANIPLFLLNRQIQFLVLNLNPFVTIKFLIKSIFIGKHKYYSYFDSIGYNFITLLIWEYVRKNDKKKLMDQFAEPEFGNPPKIFDNGKLISQDIANSILEYESIFNKVDSKKIKVICEVGAGSGRDAHVFIKLLSNLEKYIIIDISPALAISEQYLQDVFPEKKVFKYRNFKNYEEIKSDFEKAEIVFLMPHQIEKLPDGTIDLFVNISSFHEMSKEQINYYFNQIDRLSRKRGYLYFKEWKFSRNDPDDINVVFDDYPVKKNWKKIYVRTPKVQIKFFEALYNIN